MNDRLELAHESELLAVVAAKKLVPEGTFDDPDVRAIGLELIRKVERAVGREDRKLLQRAAHRPPGNRRLASSRCSGAASESPAPAGTPRSSTRTR
jgi:hypothetical protein